jgi:hypothetical protein
MAYILSNLSSYSYNPNLIQRDILKLIGDYGITISDPTSPFVTLLEAAAVSTVNNLIEYRALIRKTYPALAINRDELFRHIHNSQFANISATPASAEFIFMLPINDIISNGYQDTTANTYSTRIPHDSIITVGGLEFTILNPINIAIYVYDIVTNNQTKNIIVTEELHPDNLDVAYNRSGVISHDIVMYKNQLYIKFKVRIKQVVQESKVYTTPVNGTLTVTSTIPSGYQFYHGEVYTRNNTGGDWYVIEKTLTDEHLDIDDPKCIVSMSANTIAYVIPEPFINSSNMGTQFMFNTYYTMGDISLPLYNIDSKNFSIKFNNTSSSKAASTITKMSINILSDGLVNGGSNQKSFDLLRDSIINNTLGNGTPITEYDLIEAGSNMGYSIKNVEDNLLQREYIATKEVSNPNIDYVYAANNVYMNTLKYRVNDYKTNAYSRILEVSSDLSDTETMIIKPNNILKYENGYLTILTDSEVKELEENISGNNIDYINELIKKNDYFVNPFHYVINYTNKGVVTTEAFNITSPSISNTTLIGYNTTISPNASIKSAQLYYRENGYYEILFDLVYNDAYSNIPPKNRGCIARIELSNGEYAYYKLGFTSGGVEDDGKVLEHTYSLKIYTDFDLTSDGTIGIKNLSNNNGISTVTSPRITFTPNVELYNCVLTSTDYKTYNNIETAWDDELYKGYTSTNDYTILSKNKLELDLAEHLPYLYRRSYYTYDTREYATYEEDIYDTYKETDFVVDTNNMAKVTWKDGTTGWVTGSYKYDDDTLPVLEVSHKAGDIVLVDDGNGEKKKVVLHAKGEVILDDEGKPKIKASGNLIRYIDMTIMDYIFTISSSSYYQAYNELFKYNLIDYIVDDMPELNKELLENTAIYYKPVKSIGTVSYKYGSGTSYQNAIVSPTVTIYSDDTDYINKNLTNITARIGNILTDIFKEDKFTLEDIRTKIREDLGSDVNAVKINGITDDDAERVDLSNTHNRFILKKKTALDNNKNIIVVYDIDIKTVNTAI